MTEPTKVLLSIWFPTSKLAGVWLKQLMQMDKPNLIIGNDDETTHVGMAGVVSVDAENNPEFHVADNGADDVD